MIFAKHIYSVSIITCCLMLLPGTVSAKAADNLGSAFQGQWKGDAKVIVAWCKKKQIALNVHIEKNETVFGSIGDAIIIQGKIRRNNWIYRLLGNKEFIIDANLSGEIVKNESVKRESIRIFLDHRNSAFVGGFHTSGSKFGGKEKMIFSGTGLKLVKSIRQRREHREMEHTQFIETENGIKLWVETDGDIRNEACLFISGAGANSSFWSDRLCSSLVNDGFFVIKYDHRDFGYSTKIDWEQHPYDVMRLAEDAICILDNLKIKRAHVVGHSMGGFIVQLLAIHFLDRVITMTSASASTNSPEIPPPPEKTWKIFMENNPQNNFEKDLPGFMAVWEYLNGTADFDSGLAIQYTKNLYNRQEIFDALGASHVKAQANLKDRSNSLKEVNIPALVLHGEEDYLVNKYGGIQTAECISNSKLVLIPKMGHIPFNGRILERFEREIMGFLNENRQVQ